jgi:DNA-binding response OmpR family regulator
MANETAAKQKIQNILIVEDEKPLCDLLESTLKHSGFNPTSTYDGESALSCLLNNKYDLVLLDLLLPKINGFEVLAQMSIRHDKTPVIVLSNLGREESKKEAVGLGVKNYFVKSETPLTDIVNAIKNFN